jgi:hypothetical protein
VTVLNIRTARAVWLVDSRDLNPRGIDIWPLLVAIRDRYSFQSFPKNIDDADETTATGIVFANGSFIAEGARYTIVKATMFSDGLVVDSGQSTDLSELFLADVLEFLSVQFGLTYTPEMVHKRIYVSEFIVRTTKDLSRLFAPLTAIRDGLQLLTGQSFEPTGFGFGVDVTTSSARPAGFRFEREVGKSFSQNRYYSAAPLKTRQHEELIAQLEALL